jgi:hypothetical protein
MIVVSPCHPATAAPITGRRRRRTVTVEKELAKAEKTEKAAKSAQKK